MSEQSKDLSTMLTGMTSHTVLVPPPTDNVAREMYVEEHRTTLLELNPREMAKIFLKEQV